MLKISFIIFWIQFPISLTDVANHAHENEGQGIHIVQQPQKQIVISYPQLNDGYMIEI